MTSRNRDYFDLGAHQRPMTGDTKTSVLTVDHLGWLVCDGRLLNVSDYQFLFKTIYYNFGSNGSGTQFKLPNPAGRVPGFVGRSSANFSTIHLMGESIGEEQHVLNIAEMPTHNHTGTTSNSSTGITLTNNTFNVPNTPTNHGINLAGTYDVVPNNGTNTVGVTDPTHNHAFTTSNTGGSNAHNNMQPTITIGNMFIYSGKPFVGSYPFTTNTNLV